MAEHVPCVYCLELPLLDKTRRGKMERCPLCKTEILVASSGTSYRLRQDDGEEIHPPPSTINRLLAFFGIGGPAAILLVIGALFLMRDGEDTPAPPFYLPDEPAVAYEDLTTPAQIHPGGIIRGQEKLADLEPATRAKDASPYYPGMVKPYIVAQARPPEPAPAADANAAAPYQRHVAVDWWKHYPSDEAVHARFAEVPEVNLEKPESFGKNVNEALRKIVEMRQLAIKHNDKTSDGYIRHLKESRPDLAGLPFVLAPACELQKPAAEVLSYTSRVVRAALDDSRPRSRTEYYHASGFWRDMAQLRNNSPSNTEVSGQALNAIREAREAFTLPALTQIIQGEGQNYRVGLVSHLNNIDGKDATNALVRIVLHDTHSDTRLAAIEALRKRPKEEYAKQIIGGLRYPFVPVMYRAAEAIGRLELKDAAPELIEILSAPDPRAPFLKTQEGEEKLTVREVVKINHHRNCLLCHAPAKATTDLVRGPIPNPHQPLPTQQYYGRDRGETFVRADITYLKQDFSALVHVKDSKIWPEMQRFDFLIRERPATAEEKAKYKPNQPPTPAEAAEHRVAARYALRQLLGRDLGPLPGPWREFLARP